MTEFFLKFPLFYLENEEIQSSAERENSKLYYLNFPAMDFLVGKIKKQEFEKSFCHFFPIFIHTLVPINTYILIMGNCFWIYLLTFIQIL